MEKRRKIALRRRDRSEVLPDRQPRQRVIDFRLHEKTLRVRYINERREPRLIACAFLRFRRACGFEFDRRVLRDFARTVQRGLRLAKLSGQVLQRLVVVGFLRSFVRCFHCLF